MEKYIEAYLRESVRAAGGLALKFVSPGYVGVPDRLILMPDAKVYFAEVKDTGRKPTARQLYVHENLKRLGFSVFVPDSREAVKEMLNEIQSSRVPDILH